MGTRVFKSCSKFTSIIITGIIVGHTYKFCIKPYDIKPTDIKPTDIKPTDIKPTDIKPTDIKLDDKLDLQPYINAKDFMLTTKYYNTKYYSTNDSNIIKEMLKNPEYINWEFIVLNKNDIIVEYIISNYDKYIQFKKIIIFGVILKIKEDFII